MVYVLNKNGEPLMPTDCNGHVYRLLKESKAKVVRRSPFTIKLNYEPETKETQEVVLGVDTGSKYLGAACYGNGKILYQSEVELRTDIKTKMTARRANRSNRRLRKTRYRKPRFLNRKNSMKLNRLPPSVRSKVNAHIREIEFCKKILPVTKLVLEVSQFDTHLMKNPALASEKVKHWGYQKGFNYSFENRKAAVRHRDKYTCQICGKKNCRLEVHHIIPRSQGGSDDEENLAAVCEKCHDDVHAGRVIFNKKARKKNLKHATHMSIIRSQLLKMYPDALETVGYITKTNRNALNLPKGHYIDACVIASGGKPFETNDTIYLKKCVAKGEYALTKGKDGKKEMPKGKICGFRKYDKVEYLGNVYFIKGRMSSGYAWLMDIHGNVASFDHMPKGQKTPKLRDLKRLSARKTVLCIEQKIAQTNLER